MLDYGLAKRVGKGCNLLVVNEVGGDGNPKEFEGAYNAAVILGSDGSATDVPLMSKEALSDVLWDLVAARLP